MLGHSLFVHVVCIAHQVNSHYVLVVCIAFQKTMLTDKKQYIANGTTCEFP